MPRCPTPKSTFENWRQFLRNHSEFIFATDFFSVPTACFRNLYILFVIHHESRRIIHVNATFNPNASWIIQQLREAFPGEHGCKYLILDRDAKFSPEVLQAIKEFGIKPSRIAPRCPWQNQFAERWVGTARRDLFDRVVVFGRVHALALLRPYLDYYHEDRTHLGLTKDTPAGKRPCDQILRRRSLPCQESAVCTTVTNGSEQHSLFGIYDCGIFLTQLRARKRRSAYSILFAGVAIANFLSKQPDHPILSQKLC